MAPPDSAALDSAEQGSAALARLALWLLARFGWQLRFSGLPGPKGVLIFYPHTSNWDFIISLLAKWASRMPLRWIGKESLFRGLTGATLGRLMRLWGGRPVDRRHPSGAVAQLEEHMRREPWFWVALSPEGTRRRQDRLRSGFYHLALRMQVPLGLGYIDYATRTVGVDQFILLTGDEARDLDRLRQVYADKVGRHPQLASTIGLREPNEPHAG